MQYNTTYNMLAFIVEDSEMYALMLEHKLSKEGNFCIRKFSTGEECVSNLHLNPDLVILDYNLPGINGLETLKRIKKTKLDLPVLVISAQQDLKIAIDMFGEGAFDYITKDSEAVFELNKAIHRIAKNQTSTGPKNLSA